MPARSDELPSPLTRIRNSAWTGLVYTALTLISIFACTPLSARQSGNPSAGERLFAQRVWPVFAAKCLACHGEDGTKIKGGLDLRSRAGALRGGDSGKPAFIPGEPENSLLLTAVMRADEDLAMPPKENDRLDPEQIASIRDWILSGAPWPDSARLAQLAEWEIEVIDPDAGLLVKTSGGLTPEWDRRHYQKENLWAYQPLRKPSVPASEGATAHPIDAFINRRLEAMGLQPAPRADRRTLIRRVTFDLLGLPPTPEQIDAFHNDSADDDRAFAAVVDRLLASSHYGERWAQHWLDVVRYADSSGLANDFERPNAWRYRDYVVRAFNSDKPYNLFIQEQIAGDELDPSNPELLIATGFLRMGPWELTGMEVPKIARQKFLDDVTDLVGQVFLSHPLQCARCHDHKFDPVPTRDYYRLQAVFATTQLTDRDAPFLPHENLAGFEERELLKKRIIDNQAFLRQIREKEEKAARQWYAERGWEYIARNEALKRGLPEERIAPRHINLDAQDLGIKRIAEKNLARFRWELDRYEPVALSVYSGKTPALRHVDSRMRMPQDPEKGTLDEISILAGGDPFSPVLPVDPGVLSAIAAFNSAEPGQSNCIPTRIEGRRKAFAKWVADSNNPIPARSMVNRIWLGHFGQGLAGNPNNFGATGKKPTHPELLDWLAATLIEQGWSIKSMHRLILMSQAYRRSASHPELAQVQQRDPSGSSYAVFKPRRLSAEELRDSMLALSGELNPALGGIPIRPEIDREVALQPRQIMGTYAPAYQPSPAPEQRHRRSIYALKLRGLPDPFGEIFNAPNSEQPCEFRETSTVTPQVFALFNSEQVYARALAMAKRLSASPGGKPETIRQAFALAFGRDPTASELSASIAHWDRMTERHRGIRFDPPVFPKEVVRQAVDENTGEKFTFTEQLEVYQNFQPDLHPSALPPEIRGLAEVCLVLLNANEFVYVY